MAQHKEKASIFATKNAVTASVFLAKHSKEGDESGDQTPIFYSFLDENSQFTMEMTPPCTNKKVWHQGINDGADFPFTTAKEIVKVVSNHKLVVELTIPENAQIIAEDDEKYYCVADTINVVRISSPKDFFESNFLLSILAVFHSIDNISLLSAFNCQEVIQCLLDKGIVIPEQSEILVKMASIGSIPLIDWAIEKGFQLTERVANYAARSGHNRLLQYLVDKRHCPVNETELYLYAVQGNRSSVLDWADNRGYQWDAQAYKEAASQGRLDTLQWFHQRDLVRSGEPKWNAETTMNAAAYHDLFILKWLLEQDPPCPIDVTSCQEAALKGNLPAIQFLRGLRPPVPWDESVITDAIKSRCGELVDWLIKEGCPYGPGATCRAAENGDLELLKRLRQLDPPCSWNGMLILYSRETHPELAEWALKNGCPLPTEDETNIKQALDDMKIALEYHWQNPVVEDPKYLLKAKASLDKANNLAEEGDV